MSHHSHHRRHARNKPPADVHSAPTPVTKTHSTQTTPINAPRFTLDSTPSAAPSHRTGRSITVAVLGIWVAAMSFFPLLARDALGLGTAVSADSARLALVEAELAARVVESRELAGEMRHLKDSILAILTAPRAARLARPLEGSLLFDNRLPVSFDNGDRTRKVVALTFDGDGHDNASQEILDTLASRGVKATMFVTGRFIERRPGLIARIVSEGHVVGNHMYGHPHLTAWEQIRVQQTLPDVTAAMVARQLARADSVFYRLTGRWMAPIWRAPYGDKNRTVCAWGQQAGYLHVGWRQGRTWKQSLDSNDWIPNASEPGYFTPSEVVDKFLNAAREEPYGINGGIILMHLGTVRAQRSQQVHLVVGTLIDRLRELGYSFVTIPQMAEVSEVDLSLLRSAAPAASSAMAPASR